VSKASNLICFFAFNAFKCFFFWCFQITLLMLYYTVQASKILKLKDSVRVLNVLWGTIVWLLDISRMNYLFKKEKENNMKIFGILKMWLNNRINPVLSRNWRLYGRSFPEDCLGSEAVLVRLPSLPPPKLCEQHDHCSCGLSLHYEFRLWSHNSLFLLQFRVIQEDRIKDEVKAWFKVISLKVKTIIYFVILQKKF